MEIRLKFLCCYLSNEKTGLQTTLINGRDRRESNQFTMSFDRRNKKHHLL